MKNKRLYAFILLGLFGFTVSFAANEEIMEKEDPKDALKNPYGCFDMGFAFDLKAVTLASDKQGQDHAMYLLYNKSNQNITLYQMRNEESSRSMYLNHHLPAKQWTVFATSEQKVKYICAIPKQGSLYGDIVDCGEHLKICEFTHVKFGLNNAGNFWMVNSSSKNTAVRSIVHYGIIPSFVAKPKKGAAL